MVPVANTRHLQPCRSPSPKQVSAPVLQGLKAMYPRGGGRGAVEFFSRDLAHLEPGEFVNDSIMDFFMRYFLGITLSCPCHL